jgi:hypothetical protein
MLECRDSERRFVRERCLAPLSGGPLRVTEKTKASEREASRLGRRVGDISSRASHEEVPSPTLPRLSKTTRTLEVRCIDRLYLNAYLPRLQSGGGVVDFLLRG